MSNHSFETTAIRAGQEPNQWNHHSIVPPIVLATTYEQIAPGKPYQFEYGRSGNPTRNCLEKVLVELENGKHGFVYASGLAALTNVTHLLSSGDHLICGDDVYGGTNRYFSKCASRMGIEVSFVPCEKIESIEKAIKSNTKMIWFEPLTNPMMNVSDIAAIVAVARRNGNIIVVVDNTFLSSYFLKPLDFGADIVLHSISKYINGHSDVIMGAAITKNDEIGEKLRFFQNSLGAVPSPFDCYLVNRGIKTLAIRMRQHQKNAIAVAKELESSDKVERVYHPGLESHSQYELGKRQFSGYSGMISVVVKGGGEKATAFMKNLKLFTLAESLGAVESICELPAIMTHASVPADQREKLGISDGLIRLSVGIEDTNDLVNDIKNALSKL